ncbi:PilZ domain-containing protein [Cohnella yongneupensis]|uniref:PilZ domain-containing protein n=1 Tax=Cohnella yongneupensis TaxID=425006 RepID=A0ABW0R0W0_9BACL
MSQAENSKPVAADDRDLLPLNVLLHCRTVVESANVVTTGVMTHVEGELFEVELHDFEQFELGETVKITVYSPAGLQSIQSIVFAKYEGAIALLQPPNLQKRFKERREHPRISINGNAQVFSAVAETGEEIRLEQPLELTVHDISLSGIGFSGPDATQINRNMKLKAIVEIGFGFSCELEIIRRERQEDKVLLGAKMHVIEPDMMRPLRAMILRHQVEKHAELRRESQKKRFIK